MMKYKRDSKWKYTLTEDYVLKVNNVDFGCFTLVCHDLDTGRNRPYVTGCGDTLTIFKGYSWDGCTAVPDYSWNLEASLVHDALYQSKKCDGGEACEITWYQVDRLFLNMMKNLGASWIQRNTYYAGVRTFGFFFKLTHLDDGTVVGNCHGGNLTY